MNGCVPIKHGRGGIHSTLEVLGAGAAVAAGRGGGGRGRQIRRGRWIGGGAGHGAADGADDGGVAGSGRTVRTATCARMPRFCWRLWRLGYRRTAWMAGIGLGAATVMASLVAGLLGPVAIAAYATVLSVPVWIACYWLMRRG